MWIIFFRSYFTGEWVPYLASPLPVVISNNLDIMRGERYDDDIEILYFGNNGEILYQSKEW